MYFWEYNEMNIKNVFFRSIKKISMWLVAIVYPLMKSNTQNSIEENKNKTILPTFFVLARQIGAFSGYAIPINTNTGYAMKTGDVVISESQLFYPDAKRVIDFFLQKHAGKVSISEQDIAKDVVVWSGFSGNSADLMLYSYLVAKYLHIDLENIFIAGTGAIHFETGEVYSCSSFFYKIDVAVCHGIKIFVFSEEQRADVENYCHVLRNNGFAHLVDKCYFYYVNTVDDVEEVLKKISNDHKEIYKSDITLKLNVTKCNLLMAANVDKNNVIIKEYIKNKKEYGMIMKEIHFLYEYKNMIQKCEGSSFLLIELVKSFCIIDQILNQCESCDKYKIVLSDLLNKYVLIQDDFYGKYIKDFLTKFIFDDILILDL